MASFSVCEGRVKGLAGPALGMLRVRGGVVADEDGEEGV